MTDPLLSRIRGMISRAIVNLVDDGRRAQELQIDLFDGESQDGVERFQNYGFASHPKPGAEAIAACIGGLRSHVVVIAVEDRRFRLKDLAEGEVALFDDLGNVIKLGRERISIDAVSAIEITAPDGDVVVGGVSLRHHTHGGVQAGAAQSGEPA